MKRSGLPQRTKPMPRGEGPARKTGLARGTAPPWRGFGSPLVPAKVTVPAGQRRPRRRETGFTPEIRLAVRTRAGDGDPLEARCECCGRWLGLYGGQVHHRCNRGMGGSRTRNTIQNAALLCGDPYTGCHGAATREEKRMKDRGFLLDSGQKPLLVAVKPYGTGRPGRWLTADGRYTFSPPEGAEVA